MRSTQLRLHSGSRRVLANRSTSRSSTGSLPTRVVAGHRVDPVEQRVQHGVVDLGAHRLLDAGRDEFADLVKVPGRPRHPDDRDGQLTTLGQQV
jgi:hypothetical protein